MTGQLEAAVVTGGAQGIGFAIARELAAAGRPVALLGTRDATAGQQAASALGPEHIYVRCNVSQENQVSAAISEVTERLGAIEVLINNAGVGSAADPADLTEDAWDTFFGVDLKGVWLCTKHAIPQMRRLGRGVVINISSIHAHLTRAGIFPYPAAKAGVLGLTRSLALDLAPANIRVNAVCPGFIRTPPIEALYRSRPDAWARLQSVHPLARIGEPDEVAHVVAFLASDKASFITGATWNVDGGLSTRFAT